MRTKPFTSVGHAAATVVLLLVLALFAVRPVPAHTGEHQDVLILQSYHPGLPWTDSVMAGMRGVLGGLGNRIHLHVEYLDTLRYTSPDYAAYVLDAIFRYKLQGRRFAVVLLADNPALAFALKHRQDFFRDTPIVFCGINNFQPPLIAGFPDVTGIAEYPSYRETIATALRLHPGTAEIVVIGGVANLTSRENRRMLQDIVAEAGFGVPFDFWDDIPFEELTERLAKLPRNTLVLINGSVAFRTGEILSYEEGMRALRAACPSPIYSFWEFFLGEGIIGGKLVSGRDHGELAARMALRILQGEDADAIPVVSESNHFMFDYRELARFSLSVRQLPPDSVVINQPLPIYALSRRELWVLVGIMTALIVVLAASVVLLRRAKSAVGREKERVALLLTSAAEAIYGLDLAGRCTFCNPAAARLLGYPEDALVGQKIHPIIHHSRADGTPYPESECRIFEVLSKEITVHGEDEVFWRADGSSFPIEYWSYPIRRGQEKIGALVTFLDISERKRAEAEREKALNELDAFVYTVSHDLRTPLTAIIGFSEFLHDEQEKSLTENARVALAEIRKQGERMAAMMEDLLALARVGRLPRPAEAVNVEEVVQDVLREFGTELAAGGLTVRTEPLPAVHLPPTFLLQLFSNLIGNAIRYAGAAGGPIEIGGARARGRVCFFVRDHGPGIPQAERERIFDVFYRGSTGSRIAGTGIGLATVMKIAQFYAGDAWVTDTPGGGATFWVEMDDQPPRPPKLRAEVAD